jgi:hypothetical protein
MTGLELEPSMTETELEPDVIVYYIDNETGQVYAECGNKIFEMEIGDDVTDDMEMKIADFEVLRVYDPNDVERYEGLRIEEALDIEEGEET